MTPRTVEALEAELRRRYRRSAPGLLLNLPLDEPSRIRALSRLLNDDKTASADHQKPEQNHDRQ